MQKFSDVLLTLDSADEVQRIELYAHLYVFVMGAFIFAVGSDIRHAVQLIGKAYGG